MGARMREMDWSTTSLGPPDTLAAESSQHPQHAPAVEGADRPLLGTGVPRLLQRRVSSRRSARSIRTRSAFQAATRGARSGTANCTTLLAGVVETGEAFWAQDLLFELERYGFLEETYFDVSYDPVRVESGAVGGVFCIVTETTARVVGERRMALLRDLAARNATARTARDACILATETLAAKPDDITFALAYLDDELQSVHSRGARAPRRRGARSCQDLRDPVVGSRADAPSD